MTFARNAVTVRASTSKFTPISSPRTLTTTPHWPFNDPCRMSRKTTREPTRIDDGATPDARRATPEANAAAKFIAGRSKCANTSPTKQPDRYKFIDAGEW
eukprot:CAMPEP_0179706282 /NCGR_PEP_ID=MMETSP0937-20121108/4261_1 /TAXON_ID=548131 ORGANISM="Ostreococcus mediterraneus, Strain clade-D-RCC2593" /NCGR_SAMPLE_ID=MMETSP0937 /ASSEMBLY_ACC=CAM_ASM_000575 /LENGTH=99 /DNA_ID=CAMNT_0021579539 /DNA_START=102 /DNA_END=398 /DNA_ORIENTATION=-